MIDSKGISCNVAENINKLLNEKVMPSTVVHNYYNSGHVVNASSATIDRRSIKKQKVFYESHSRKKEKEEDENWLTILEDCETQKYLHKYRKAPKLDLLNAEVTHGLTKKVKKITNVILKKSSITHSEAVYNDRFVFGLTGVLLDEFDNHEMSPFFVPGEEELVAMTTRIKKLKLKVDYRMIYKADGVVCSENDLDLVLLETAGAFKKNDPSKIAFDNSKGMFALLAMLKTIADKYTFASRGSFKKLKFLYLQPSDCYLRLWQMKYSKNELYEYVRIAKAVVSEEKKDEEACIDSLTQFILNMKDSLNETPGIIQLLEEEHEARK